MTSSRLLARALALSTSLVAVAACDDGRPFEPAPAPTPTTEAAPLIPGVPVIVTNPAANPVKTAAVGTTTVDGTVAATQAGAWNVRVDNPSLTVAGTVAVSGGAVAATQAGAWGVTVTEPVAIAPGASVAVNGLPPVTIAPGASVAVNSLPPVAIAGTPTVAIAGTPTVAIAGGAQLSGAVEVTNLPAVQEISGTVAIEPRQPTWGSKSLSLGAAVLPAGLVLTDVSLTLLSPGAACTVRLNEKLAGVEAFRQLIWKLDEAHPVIEMHLQTGITSQTGTRQFEITLIDGTCLPLVLWSGYVP